MGNRDKDIQRAIRESEKQEKAHREAAKEKSRQEKENKK